MMLKAIMTDRKGAPLREEIYIPEEIRARHDEIDIKAVD